ncbi:MAG: gamma-aminobutyraldehyde dehydrogenase [Candidatus Dormibacteraeota bacterium]|nr:gamma-aminobutyraldehyde dehydrogenase [Candidatus Dormibacteraeota bacterium]
MSTKVAVRGNFIGGEWLEDVGEGSLEVLNPSTGEVIAEVPNASAETVDRTVKAAERAFAKYSDTTPAERAGYLLKLGDAVEDHAEELGRLESENVGKPVAGAIEEMGFIADCFRFFAGAARNIEGKASGEYIAGRTSMIRREPIGVCAGIAPWNYPLMMAVWKIGPALASGNVSIIKPSELTPLTTLKLAELAADILPPGVFNVITGDGLPTGDALVRHPRVRFISITGDVSTGKLIARNATDNLKRVHLELGGKAPAIVFDDADMERVAKTLRLASFYNSGQDCTAACRVLVQGKVYDKFLSDFVPQIESLNVGDPGKSQDVEMGPVISAEQKERVLGFVERAEAAGGRVASGGESVTANGFFVQPTVVTDVNQEAEIIQKEVFGPVVTVQRFTDEEQAIEWANGVEYGLAASVWSKDAGRLMRVARKIQFGCVWLNDHVTLVNEMPHGGFKQSGYGKDMSMYSLEDYTVVKHVMLNIEP